MLERLSRELEDLEVELNKLKDNREAMKKEEDFLRFKLGIIEASPFYIRSGEILNNCIDDIHLMMEQAILKGEKIETKIIKSELLHKILFDALNSNEVDDKIV